MRWVSAALADLVAVTACAPLLPSTASPAPASPTLAARPTPRPTLTARGRSWLTTLEGREFENAFTFFRSAYPAEAETWGINVSDVENYADVCTAWYYPYGRDRKVDAFQPLLQFARKWLPR